MHNTRERFIRHRIIRRGFTLVELLVVIGIIGVLISILLPSLYKARQTANAVKCASNLRQIALGWNLYADANKGASAPGRMPNLGAANNLYYVGNGTVWRPRWFVTLGAQSRIYAYHAPNHTDGTLDNTANVDNQVFICPTEPERINNRNFTYGYNYQFLGNSRNKAGTPSGTFNPIHFPVRASRVRAAETVLAADAIGTAAGKAETARLGYNVTGSSNDLNSIGNHAWSMDPPRIIVGSGAGASDICDDGSPRIAANRSAPEERHSRKANVAFCDGHVQAMTLGELGYAVNDDGVVLDTGTGQNGVTAHNRLFDGRGDDRNPPSIN
jgi:prepilin-type N-terminal cleavage/methylation domain-containing protein/prepilin-type processing-associated H-X9-DG protein